jgi:hypothetical protein
MKSSGSLHLEVHEGRERVVNRYFFTASKVGVGLTVASRGTAEVRKFTFEREFKNDIIAGKNGTLVFENDEFYYLELDALVCLTERHGRIVRNRITKSDGNGIELQTQKIDVHDSVLDKDRLDWVRDFGKNEDQWPIKIRHENHPPWLNALMN